MMEGAEMLALVDVGGARRWRVHSMVAEVARRAEEGDVALERMTAWFVGRLADPKEGWAAVLEEREALAWWLGVVPEEDWPKAIGAGSGFAMTNGPFAVWMDFCERALSVTADDAQRSKLLWLLANVAQNGGALERASIAAEEMRELAVRMGDDHNRALAWTALADVHASRGQTREAARILQEEVLPVLEQEGKTADRMGVFMKLNHRPRFSNNITPPLDLPSSG
jgi:hypothetical protein